MYENMRLHTQLTLIPLQLPQLQHTAPTMTKGAQGAGTAGAAPSNGKGGSGRPYHNVELLLFDN
jgi:hypothetical protein